jgi:hypothetical protein
MQIRGYGELEYFLLGFFFCMFPLRLQEIGYIWYGDQRVRGAFKKKFHSYVDYASTWLANHSFNLSKAFPRCETLFFSLFSISAYVWPSYSKQESQPITRSLAFLFSTTVLFADWKHIGLITLI